MLFKSYNYINILSIDVMAGASICSVLIADLLGVQLPWSTVVLLALTVWLIYTFDHLLDARNISHEAATARHRFHQDHFKKLASACLFALLCASVLIFKIPQVTVVWGAALSCLVVGYFVLLYFLKLKCSYHKETLIALLYGSGVFLGPVSIYEGKIETTVWLIFGQFVLLAFTNLLLFAVYEFNSDQRDNSPSLVQVIGKPHAEAILKVLVILQVCAAVQLSFNSSLFHLEVIILIMTMVLGGILISRPFFAHAERYRIVGDAVFLFPVIVLL